MKNPFGSPEKPASPADESVDVDLSGLNEEFGAGIRDFEPEDLARRHEEEARKLAPERRAHEEKLRSAEAAAMALAASAETVFLKRRFKDDPQAKRRFLKALTEELLRKADKYQCEPSELLHVERFLKEDLAAFSINFEDEELHGRSQRKAS